jgi:hypothetical protein
MSGEASYDIILAGTTETNITLVRTLPELLSGADSETVAKLINFDA